jgi:hypothetical protein
VDKDTAALCNAGLLSVAVTSDYFWLHVVLVLCGLLLLFAMSVLLVREFCCLLVGHYSHSVECDRMLKYNLPDMEV